MPPPAKPVTPGLYVVATPIGNLRDITLRALDVLSACDVVLAEDTRVAARLLTAHDLKKPLVRYDDHCGPQVLPSIIARLQAGEIVAQVSDAGTPLISDPGFRLVRAAHEAGVRVHPLPGASSVLAALTLAGLPTDRFLFAGFLPAKSAARRTFLSELTGQGATLVFFETGPRVRGSLADMAEVLGNREACVCRELTKLYETAHRGMLSQLAVDPALESPRGEIVVIVGPPPAPTEAEASLGLEDSLKAALRSYAPSEAARQVASLFNLPRKEVYRLALALRDTGESDEAD